MIVHTYPARDVIEHVLVDGDCDCWPRVQTVSTDDGETNLHVVHNAIKAGTGTEQG